jgi:hypothetical protein
MTISPPESEIVGHAAASAWSAVLDSLSAQVELQERCVRLGHMPPPDLEIEPPTEPLVGDDRLRALELFERCEALALEAARGLATTRSGFRSAYADDAATGSSSITSTRS